MRYDFETLVDRSHCGSGKWDEMREKNPSVAPEVVPLSVADMEFKNAPEIQEGIKAYVDSHILGYTSPTEEYLQAVCGWMKEQHGWEIQPEWICGTHGVVTALFMLVSAFCQPGDGVIILTPVHYPFYMAIDAHGCKTVRCPLVHQEDRYTIDFPLLEELAADPDNKMLIFCSPHNPVGRVWTPEELKKVSHICHKNGVKVISDEIHFDLVLPGHKHTVFSTVAEDPEDVIVCTAPSKTFNLAAMQTSNIIIPKAQDREKFAAVRGKYADHDPCALGLEACRVAYTQGKPWMEEMLSVIAGNYQFAKEFMETRLPQLKVTPLEGTYLLWVDCTALGLSKEALEELMVRKAQLFLDEGYMFGEEGAGFERINLAVPQWVLKAALERLEAAVKAL